MDSCGFTGDETDQFTMELIDELFTGTGAGSKPSSGQTASIKEACDSALQDSSTRKIILLFEALLKYRREAVFTPDDFGLARETIEELASKHQQIDEHGVTVGGRLLKAAPIVEAANARVADYMAHKDAEAPSGIELWDQIQENGARIRKALGMSDEDWGSFPGQLKYAINTVDELARVIDLPASAIRDVTRVTSDYRMRLTPYYAGLIMPGRLDDPVLIQSVPTGEMVDNVGEEIPPVAADHSPARLVDQFYPRVVSVKVTNICAMYCTHCLRIAHIGKKDRIYSRDAYQEALDYIRGNPLIRDVLITGGDAFMLPNRMIRWILEQLDGIDHVRMKRLGTRIPVTVPMRLDAELFDILNASNLKKPLRVVTQINTAQEITPISREGFKNLSSRVSAVLNQAVLLKGINDTSVKMWKLCETIQESYVRPYYIFNCSYRNPQFRHLRVPVETGRDIVEGMYGNISGDAIPRYISTAGGKIPMHRDNIVGRAGAEVTMRKPWSGEEVSYPDADPKEYDKEDSGLLKYK
ncbi:glutamate 2,3-aminomutase [bacterium BMS3Abin14]|nr:glutamate 2,3-aminomutase [bacterium BMS3Abin14]